MTSPQRYLLQGATIALVLIGSVVVVRATLRHLHPAPTLDSLTAAAIDNYWCGKTVSLSGIAEVDPVSPPAAARPTYRLVSALGHQLTVESNADTDPAEWAGRKLSVRGQLVCQYLLSTDTPFVVRFIETGRDSLED